VSHIASVLRHRVQFQLCFRAGSGVGAGLSVSDTPLHKFKAP
jgi:hypothetical protein